MKLSPTIIVVQYISPLESDHPKLFIDLPTYFKIFKVEIKSFSYCIKYCVGVGERGDES